jgi:putative DNA primase/helicase
MMLQPFKLTDGQDVLDLAAVVPAGAVVVVDTLNRAAPTADENSSRDMGEILEAAKTLQTLTRGLVVLVHHTGKNAAAGLRGHSSLFAAMDAAIEVSREGDRREWKVAKSKDGH